ncbi:MAG: acetyltransferase-like isoleucine patch superfamily enzyme [Candidatus Azotimanducaceae bacterium]
MTRRNRQPFWLKSIRDRINGWYVNHFIRPEFDAAGYDLRVMTPRSLDISGPNIRVGDHVHFMALPDKPVRLAVFEGLGKINIGSYSIINPGVRITSADEINIGEGCMLATNCYLSDADWHDLNHRIYAPGKHAPINLADNVWIGDGALVTKGVSIGENSIVGANSVVTKDVPDNCIVAGNPARQVRELSDQHITTRRDLFNMHRDYHEFEAEYFRELLSGNTISNWLRALMWPNDKD